MEYDLFFGGIKDIGMKSKGKKIGVALLVIVFLLALPYAYDYIRLNSFIKW